jgi:hypothetical protein
MPGDIKNILRVVSDMPLAGKIGSIAGRVHHLRPEGILICWMVGLPAGNGATGKRESRQSTAGLPEKTTPSNSITIHIELLEKI